MFNKSVVLRVIPNCANIKETETKRHQSSDTETVFAGDEQGLVRMISSRQRENNLNK